MGTRMLSRIVTSPGGVGIIDGMDPTRNLGRRAFYFACAALAVLAMANAFLYAATSAIWVPTSDNWFYLDRIVYPYAHGNFDPGMLFIKRGVFDHSQPLRRLLLLANYEWFDIDLRVEAAFAVLVGIVDFLLIAYCARRELRAGFPVAGIAIVALAAVYFSLSATVVFTWSLLTLSFSSQLFVLLWILASWAVLQQPSPRRIATLAFATLAMGVVSDDTALVAVVAGVIASVIHARGRANRAALSQIGASVAGFALYAVLYRMIAPVVPDAMKLNASSIQNLYLALGDAWQFAVVPLVSALVHKVALKSWFGGSAGAVVVAVGICFLFAHAWFWKQAFVGERNRTAFMAQVFMLLFYGLVAGIVIGRVSEYGVKYLWQPRYAVVYRWHLVALLLMVVAQAPRLARAQWARRWSIALVSMVLLVQLPISMSAWADAKYVRNANARMATQILEMGETRAAEPPRACAAQLTICKFDDPSRQRVIRFLQEQRLSAFSPGVRERNHYSGD